MKRRTVQTYHPAGRLDALLSAPGSVANRRQWTHNWETPLPFWGAQEGIAPRAGRQLSELAASQGFPTAAAAATAAAPSPPRHLRRRGPAPTWRPSRTEAEAAASEKPSGAAPKSLRGSGKVWGLVLRHRSGGAFCTGVIPLSVCPSSTNVRAQNGLGGGGGGVGKGGARSMRGAAGGRPGQRPPLRAPPGFCLSSPRTLEHFCSESGPHAFRALVSVVDPPQSPKGTGGATLGFTSIQSATPPFTDSPPPLRPTLQGS